MQEGRAHGKLKGKHRFKILAMPAAREIPENDSFCACFSAFLVSEWFATHMETKIPVTHRKQSSPHNLVRYTSRLPSPEFPA